MNWFDKICVGMAFVLGLTFLILGALGLFMGCKANFILPPVFGVIPAFFGWGIVRGIWYGWFARKRALLTPPSPPASPRE
jgi:hypothetical protein